MKGKIAIICLVLLCVFLIVGCESENNDEELAVQTHGITDDVTVIDDSIFSQSHNANVIKVMDGEFSEDKYIYALTEYQKNYAPIDYQTLADGRVVIELDFEATSCYVAFTSRVDEENTDIERQSYIALAVDTEIERNKVAIDTSWWTMGGWEKNYPLWSYLVRINDEKGIAHYYYFRTDYSSELGSISQPDD